MTSVLLRTVQIIILKELTIIELAVSVMALLSFCISVRTFHNMKMDKR